MQPDLDTQTGLSAMNDFFNSSLKFSNFDFRSFDEFLKSYGTKGEIYAEGIGLAIRANGMSSSQVAAAMKNLADKSQGKVPRDHQAYNNALLGVSSEVSYLDLASNVAKETFSTVATGAQTLGNQVIKSASWLTTLLPWIAVGGVILFVVNNTGTSKEAQNLVKAAADGIKSAVKEVKKRGRKKKAAK